MGTSVLPMKSPDPSILIADNDPRVRLRAVGMLRKWDKRESVPLLRQALTADDVVDVRARAAEILGLVGGLEAANALGFAIDDNNAEVRRKILQALNQIALPSCLQPLLKSLSDRDRDIRRLAARGVGKLGGPNEIKALQPLTADPDVLVQIETRHALEAIRDRASLAERKGLLEKLENERSQSGDASEQAGLGVKIDLANLEVHQLEASLQAKALVSPPSEEVPQPERERAYLHYELQQLVRELEALSRTVPLLPMREVWEAQYLEAKASLDYWATSIDSRATEARRAELLRLKKLRDEKLDGQKQELVDMERFVQDGYRGRLRIEQMAAAIADHVQKEKVERLFREADGVYAKLKTASEKGLHGIARQQHSLMDTLLDQAEKIGVDERDARRKAGFQVTLFAFIALAVVGVGIFFLVRSQNIQTKVPGLDLPPGVIIWSLLGAIAATLYQFLNQPLSSLETIKWLVARPVTGTIMGCFLYFVIGTSILVLGDKADIKVNPQLGLVIAFLGGFSDRFSEIMIQKAASAFTRGGAAAKKKPPAGG